MLFNSLSFLFFFPLVVILYYVLPKWWRLALLLVASIYFYAAFVPQYILVLFFLIGIDYGMGLAIERTSGGRRLVMLCVSLAANIGALVIFKYLGFFETNLNALASFLHWNYSLTIIRLILPLGLSFHVFQSLSYVIEVYRRKYTAEHNLWAYALYVMFFPQLVAGPIERPAHLLPQLHAEHSFDERGVIQGLERMAWGFFKKMVIADMLAPDPV